MKDKLNKIINAINSVDDDQILIAIDGRCASGKTTIAKAIKDCIDCNVISIDDFFLRPEQKTTARLSEVGGNVDYERFEEEVLIPLSKKEDVIYQPYNCQTQKLDDKKIVKYKSITIIEGSYSCHPRLFAYYNLHIFLDIDNETQLSRLESRNPERLNDFINKWIPLEEAYFEEFKIKDKCELVVNTK